jgi:stage II sporulation protein D
MIKIFLLLLFFFMSIFPVVAEDSIRVLIIEDPYGALPSEDAEKMGTLKGDVFINNNIYHGFFDIRRDNNGLHFINVLSLERYVEGVVAAEIGPDWAYEAMKAQAVISRTYAMYQRAINEKNLYHLTSSVLHQVYRGDTENEMVKKAVKETRGQILTYNGKPIKAFYHATCAGSTELPEAVWGESFPYLRSVACMGKGSPYEQWTRRFSINKIEDVLGLNDIKSINIKSFTSTGRVDILTVMTGDSEIEVRAVDLRRLLGYRELPSTDFIVMIKGNDVIFEGKGYGHGVGLSQWGALEMALEGKDYKEILAHYYPGTELKRVNE